MGRHLRQGLRREWGPAHTSVSGFPPPHWEGTNFCCSSTHPRPPPCHCGHLLWPPWDINTAPDAPTAEKAIGCTACPGEQPGWGCRSLQHREVVAPWWGERRGLGGAQGAAAYRLGEERDPEGGWEGVAAPGTGGVCRPCVLDKDSPRGRALEGRDGLGQGWCADRPRSSTLKRGEQRGLGSWREKGDGFCF